MPFLPTLMMLIDSQVLATTTIYTFSMFTAVNDSKVGTFNFNTSRPQATRMG